MKLYFLALSKYFITFFMALYTFSCFNVFRYKNESARKAVYIRQIVYMLLIYVLSFMVIVIKTTDLRFFLFFVISLVFIVSYILINYLIYKNANRLITHNMCMLIMVSYIIIIRLSYDKAIRQLFISIFALIITSFIPFIISKGPFFSKLKWTYAILGLVTLICVLVFSVATNGAKISITLYNVTFQPSEFVKILFIFAMASFLSKANSFFDIALTSAIAAAHVLVLVLSKDLGGAVILFFIYLCMLYVARSNVLYMFLGLILGGIGSVIGYKLFSHVRVRVNAFLYPFETIDNAGYQIAQSLFAIGTGGFFGLGLFEGMPKTIPVVASDFVFSAIAEEMGVFFAICLILICLSCFVMFMNIAIKFENDFYKYVAVGLGILYSFQVLLTIGGVTKFIPLTGVTLPLVSYGGTSLLVSITMFMIIQGLYIGRNK